MQVVVEGEPQPEKIMNEFKSYASRSLNRLGRDGYGRIRMCGKRYSMSLRSRAKIWQCLWAVISDAERSLTVAAQYACQRWLHFHVAHLQCCVREGLS